MTRAVDEWIATNDDQAIPARVKVRVFDRAGGRCATCTLTIVGRLRPAYDHAIALVNGGSHRESNLQLLCVPCHAVKTRADVAEKSTTYRKRAKHIGVTGPRKKIQSAGFSKSAPQNTASRPIVRRGCAVTATSRSTGNRDHG
jgi:5-methylcytosine-specific restriction protein A